MSFEQPIRASTLSEALDVLSTDPTSLFHVSNQSSHRIEIFKSWCGIAQDNDHSLESEIVGNRTLDIGCGQGDMIEVFAAVLKTQGDEGSRVTGVDPASLDYGAPTTLRDAQNTLSSGPVGQYLNFHQSTAPELLASIPKNTYNVGYLAHSLYYFPSALAVLETFKSLHDSGTTTLMLAEWSLSISKLTALPHLNAVLLQSIDPLPSGNVITVLSPTTYIDIARAAGWELVGSRMLTPSEKLEDGRWEATMTRNGIAKRRKGMDESLSDHQWKDEESGRLESIRAHADALEASIVGVGGLKAAECMDVWTAVFKRTEGRGG